MVNANKDKGTKVSVCMPVYNDECFIGEAIDSLLAQTFTDFELVISDNASTDATPEICRKYAKNDRRMRYIRLPENKGVIYNINFLFQESGFEYFMLAAANDIWDKRYIEALVSELRADSNAILCSSNLKSIDVDGNFLANHFLERIYPSIPWQKARLSFFEYPISNVFFSVYGIYKRSILKRTGLLRGITRKEILTNCEVPFLAKLSTMGRIIAIPEFLMSYRRHPNSVYHSEITRLRRVDYVFLRYNIRLKLISICLTSNLSSNEKAEILGKIFGSWISPRRVFSAVRSRIVNLRLF